MTSRRKQTAASSNQPVGFYKLIAVSFLCLTLLLFGVIVFTSSKQATITIETKGDPVDANATISIGPMEATGTIPGIVTSTMIFSDQSFVPQGAKEMPATATGTVMLHNDSAASQSLVPKTRLLSANGILFRLKNPAFIPAKGAVAAAVYADAPGAATNIAPGKFTIPGLNDAKQKVIYAVSQMPMTGGIKHVGIFDIEDKKIIEKQIADQLLEQGRSKLSAFFPSKIGSYALTQVTTNLNADVGEQVDRIEAYGVATAVGVLYEKSLIRKYAERLLTKQAIDDTDLIEAAAEDPTVQIEDYDLTAKTAKVKLFANGIATLNPASAKINKAVFLGKTKDEVRRYLLSLDHIRAVTVTFRPAWVFQVPPIADHVKVIVKKVE